MCVCVCVCVYVYSILLGIRLAVALLSGSLSLLVTTFDAVLDVISGAIIFFTARNSKKPDKYKYPIGKVRTHTHTHVSR